MPLKEDYLPNLLPMKLTLLRYMLLSKIIIGKNRGHYRRKLSELHKVVRTYETLYFSNCKRMPFDWLLLKQHQNEIMKPPRDGLNTVSREREVIVSLTSFPPRMEIVWVVLKIMLSQTYKPDRILLYLAEEQFPGRKLPEWAELYREAGVAFIFCEEDLKPHKKYFYAMRDYPEAIIITVDDDMLYGVDLLETLMDSYAKFPKAISAMRTARIAIDENGCVLPFSEWDKICRDVTNKPLMRFLLVGVGGVLFPPNSLHREVLNIDMIKKVCLHTSDMWLQIMAVLQGTPVVLASDNSIQRTIEESQSVALFNKNKNEYDSQLNAILDIYNNYHGEDDTVIKRIMLEDTGGASTLVQI